MTLSNCPPRPVPPTTPQLLLLEIDQHQSRLRQAVTQLCLEFPAVFQPIFAQVAEQLRTPAPTDWHQRRRLNHIFKHNSFFNPAILEIGDNLSRLLNHNSPHRARAYQYLATTLPQLALSRQFILTQLVPPAQNTPSVVTHPTFQYLSQQMSQIDERATDIMDLSAPLIKGIVRRFARFLPAADEEDLQQLGRLAMLRAIEQFVPGKNIDFPQFASICIERALESDLRRRGWRTTTYQVYRHLQKLQPPQWHTLSAAELSAATGLSEAEVRTECERLNFLITGPLDSAAATSTDQTPYQHLLQRSRRALLRTMMMKRLKPKARLVIALRHGLPEGDKFVQNHPTAPQHDDYSLTAIGQIIGNTGEYVRQVNDNALRVLTKRGRWIENL